MPQDAVSSAVANAKKALDEANKMFPSPAPKPKPAATPKAPATPKTPSVGDELKVKAHNIDEYAKNAPKYHKGGHVGKEGGTVEEGETVLPKGNPKKSAELAMEHLGMEAGMHEAKPKKKAARKAKRPAPKKHGRPATTHVEHLEDGSHIIKHTYKADKDKGLMPEESKHVAMNDQDLHDHMQAMMQAPEAPELPAASAEEPAAAPQEA